MSTSTTITNCTHCGTPFISKADKTYCCHGCKYVAQLLNKQDLERFYELKGQKIIPPVGSKVFHENDTAPLIQELKKAETYSEKSVTSARYSIEGISCIGCVWLIEAIFNRQAGAVHIRIEPQVDAIEISWQRNHFNIKAFAIELQKVGYRLSPYSEDFTANNNTKQLTHRLGLCSFFLLNTMLFTLPGYLGMDDEFFLAPLFQLLSALFATLSLLVGGGYFISRAWEAAKCKVLHIDLPIATGLTAAYLGSLIGWYSGYNELIYFDFVATFVFLMLLGRWLQEYALERNRSHLQRQQYGPQHVTQFGGAKDGERLAVDAIKEKLKYSIAPGDINPVAADLLDDNGVLSLEWINGEAEPVIWEKTRITPAGSINVGLHSLRFRARENWEESLLAKLLERPSDRFQNNRLQRVLKWYISTILIIASMGSASWLIATGDLLKATQVLISILVISCPCALGVALPMCDEFAITRLRRTGLFIKSGQIWERIRMVNTVVFDKTGTLTMDTPRLDNPMTIKVLDPLSIEALAHLVSQNLHPIARSLREIILANHSHIKESLNQYAAVIKETIGHGVSWKDLANNQWTLGKPNWCAKHNDGKDAHSVFRKNGLLVAAFHFSEDVRDDARSTLEKFEHSSLKTIILSGDIKHRVTQIANQLGLSSQQIQANCSPADKANWIEHNAPGSTLMIGDGANDRLAFDAAICRGTPVIDRSILQASADFFFFGRSLRCIPALFAIAKVRRQTIQAIFATAVLYNITAVALCLIGKMHPLLAAILMPLSSILTLLIVWWGMSRKQS